jgi:hypothetical protein
MTKNKLIKGLIHAYAYEGARAYFRPKIKERLKLPFLKHSPQNVELRAHMRSHPQFIYLGFLLELTVALTCFLFLVLGTHLFTNKLKEILTALNRANSTLLNTLEALSIGVSFVALVFLAAFLVKLYRDFLKISMFFIRTPNAFLRQKNQKHNPNRSKSGRLDPNKAPEDTPSISGGWF